VKKKLPDGVPKPGKFRLAGGDGGAPASDAAAADASEATSAGA
jgi:hypothetical protein